MMARKPDADRITSHLNALANASWLGPTRKWWPQFVFHFTDLRNVVSILSQGKLLARSRCGIATDIASAEVLAHTDDAWKDFVRLYFRPRTPMQWNIEGIRPRGQLTSLNAHCPVPVFLLFDSTELLTRSTTQFSEGNLAANSTTGDDAAYFAAIPFEKVYHNSWLSEVEKRNIVFHRHAEVLIPEELDLGALKYIICRSEAELETLRNRLPPDVCAEFNGRICEARRANLFDRSWMFVETTSLEQQKVTLNFNPSTKSKGPFSVVLNLENLLTNERYHWSNPNYQANQQCTVRIPQLIESTPYEAVFTMDDAIAFAGRFNPDLIL